MAPSLDEIVERRDRFAPFMAALGFVASTWAEYESTLNYRIWELANVEKMAGACITSQMIGPAPRFRCFLALLELRKAPADLIKAFNVHHVEAEKIGRQRNRFLHDPMLLDEDTSQVCRMEITADKHVKMHLVDAEVAELKRLHHKISELMRDFDLLWDRAESELPLWPKTQFEQSPGIRLQSKETGRSA